MRVLAIILDLIFPPTDAQALVAGATVESVGRHARVRTKSPRVVSLLPYRIPLIKACVTEAKFRDSTDAQALLARVLADHLRGLVDERSAFSTPALVLVPIPLSRERLKSRGYNQCERVARTAARMVPGVMIEAALLERTRDTLPQTSLGGRARRRNLEGAFRTGRSPDPSHTYIVFDDVLTTGATLAAAMDALRNAGALNVYGLSLAH